MGSVLVEEGVRLPKNRARLGDGMIQYSLRLDHLIQLRPKQSVVNINCRSLYPASGVHRSNRRLL